jgi:hypothetical protein
MKRTVKSDNNNNNQENVGMSLQTTIQMTSSTGSDKIRLSVLVTTGGQQK